MSSGVEYLFRDLGPDVSLGISTCVAFGHACNHSRETYAVLGYPRPKSISLVSATRQHQRYKPFTLHRRCRAYT